MIAVEGDEAPERVRMRRIPNVRRDTLTDFVLDHVARGSESHRAWTLYTTRPLPFSHVVVNLSSTEAREEFCRTCTWSSRCSSAGCWARTRAPSADHLDYYLDEFTFRFNRRRARHRGLLFYRLLQGAIAAEPHPYKALTSQSAK